LKKNIDGCVVSIKDMQKDALLQERVDLRNIFEDKTSGAKDKRRGLENDLEFLQPGDCLIVWKLDRLGRSLSSLLLFNKLLYSYNGYKRK